MRESSRREGGFAPYFSTTIFASVTRRTNCELNRHSANGSAIPAFARRVRAVRDAYGHGSRRHSLAWSPRI